MEKLALISDVHSNIVALNAVIADIEHCGCKNILCCGDLVGYGPHPNEVIDRVQQLDIPTVMGNYDEAVGFKLPACGCHINNQKQKHLSNNSLKWTIWNTSAKSREYLRGLPESIEAAIGDKSILIVHSTLQSMTDYMYETDLEKLKHTLNDVEHHIYVYGHTHFPFIKSIEGKMVVNAGSVGRPKNCDNRATYVVLEFDGYDVRGYIRKVLYDVEKVAREIEASELDPYFAEYIRNGGDVQEKCSGENTCVCILDPEQYGNK